MSLEVSSHRSERYKTTGLWYQSSSLAWFRVFFFQPIEIISLCSFESLKGNIWIESPWCKLFTETEFKGNEYYYDLSKFYDHSWGSPYGRVSGIGLVNEIIARLEEKRVLLGSGTNSTLDTDPKTFPLGQSIYADFSHDNNLAALLPALGLEWETDLPSQPHPDGIPYHK